MSIAAQLTYSHHDDTQHTITHGGDPLPLTGVVYVLSCSEENYTHCIMCPSVDAARLLVADFAYLISKSYSTIRRIGQARLWSGPDYVQWWFDAYVAAIGDDGFSKPQDSWQDARRCMDETIERMEGRQDAQVPY